MAAKRFNHKEQGDEKHIHLNVCKFIYKIYKVFSELVEDTEMKGNVAQHNLWHFYRIQVVWKPNIVELGSKFHQ